MTGFGKSQVELPGKTVSIEIKSLNSKQLDLSIRTPSIYREKDLDIRSLVSQKLERGRIDFNLNVEVKAEEEAFIINKSLAIKYYEQLKDLAEMIPGVSRDSDILSILVRMPDVMKAEKEQLDETEWEVIEKGILEAIGNLESFREKEGLILENDMVSRIRTILELMDQISEFEGHRISSLRDKILTHLKDYAGEKNLDTNRFEQEMLYYLEKLDITEEKVRLKKHCEYFLETMKIEASSGKKLGFIGQEIGREINTLGSKANDAQIQKLVVQMKDELEKIKEQLSNIL